ncbi:MAG: hypothetical protein ABW019_18325 [Chitinophagaceae bacterium]
MASYLLLRNNKESGPHEFADLVKQGLKPYDLVWVQGKSAAWRYPSEIEELKPHAPIVEEQPYDRFFKKKEPGTALPATPAPPPVPAATPPVEKKYEPYLPKKSVFVTLPGQRQAPPPPDAAPPVPVIVVSENPAAARVNQSNSLEDISSRYARTLQDRKNKLARKSFWLAGLKKAAVIGGLITTGVLAGFLFRPRSGDKPVTQAALTAPLPAPETRAQDSAITMTPVSEAPVETGQLLSKETVRPGLLQPETPLVTGPQKQVMQQLKLQSALPGSMTGEAVPGTSPPAALPGDPPAIKRADVNALNGERNRQVRDDKEEQKPAPVIVKNKPEAAAGAFAGQVSVSTNDYTRVAFGGIRNLELTVTNDSKHKLEKVLVELQYLKPNEEPFRTEYVQFDNLAPNTSSTRRIKDTNRGIRVSYKIATIQPQQPATALSAF